MEYAHRQLLRQGKPTLVVVVVLNDVWSKPSLENLLFEGEGYKIFVTTRSQSYESPSVEDADALPLFAYGLLDKSFCSYHLYNYLNQDLGKI